MFGFSKCCFCLVVVHVALTTASSGGSQTVLQRLEKLLECSVSCGSDTKGSVYVRWGSRTCPEKSELVYSGYTGGSHYSTSGGAANFLCLPSDPKFAPNQPYSISVGPAYVYGTEYDVHPGAKRDHESLCAVCWTPRSASLMIPAANSCRPGWTLEYQGYLMAGWPYQGRVSSEYICVDTALESPSIPAVNVDNNQAVIYYTQAKCGSFPCPPFVENKILGCVVCSK